MLLNIRILILCCCLSLAAGCATGGAERPRGSGARPASDQAPQSDPVPPAGMRLGARYMSGLNEPCYELYPVDGALAQPQALCLRNGNWETFPAIFMHVPGGHAGR